MKNKPSKFLFLFIIFPVTCLGQPKELRNKILWNKDRPLEWKDFRGPVNRKSHFSAETSAGLFYQLQQTSQNEVVINIATYFEPGKSWKKRGDLPDILLQHEQHHFDIFEVYSRIFSKNISEIKSSSAKSILNLVRKKYYESIKDLNKLSLQYDKETDHGKNEELQKSWNKRIMDLLRESDENNIKEITLKLGGT